MADAPSLPDRLKGAAGRAKATPSRVEWLFANQESVNETLRKLIAALAAITDRLDLLEGERAGGPLNARLAQLDQDGRAGVTAIGAEIHRLRGTLDAHVAQLDATVAGHSSLLQRALAAPARDAEVARLEAELGARTDLRPGLSVCTTCWNHAGFLPDAVASALAALDALPPDQQGEVLVLDDASSDETATVARALAADDPRVRLITARANLGVSRARNVLLHTVATRHAFQLDADNLAVAAGVGALFAVAQRYGSAFTYGNVLKQDGDGATLGVMSNEPLTDAWFASNYVDTMAVVDVDQVRSLGGWPTDAVFEPVEDWAVVHRLARAGRSIGFVPVVAGRYRVLSSGVHHSVHDHRIGPDRVRRTFTTDGRMTADTIAAFAAHPDLGVLWATPAAQAADPAFVPPAPPVPMVDTRPRLLVLGPGGVANLGDDAITVSALAQLRRHRPDHALDVLTDGPAPVPLGPAASWLGTLSEAVWGLRPEDLPGDDLAVAAARDRIPAVPWARPVVDLSAYAGAVFVGGGNLTSLWGDTLVAPRTVLAAALRHAGVPYLVSGQGIGPLDDAERALAAGLLDGAVAASVRDAASAGEVATAVPPTTTGDDALLLAPAAPDRVRAVLGASGTDQRPYIAVTVRDADYVGASGDALEAWAAAVDELAHRRGAIVLGVALNDQAPVPEIATLAALAHGGAARSAPWRLVDCGDDPGLLAALMAGAHAVAAHSYHAALFGLRAGVPTVLAAANPYYVAKATGLAALAGLDPAVVVVRPDEPLDLEGRCIRIAAALASGAGLDPATAAVDRWWASALAALLPISG